MYTEFSNRHLITKFGKINVRENFDLFSIFYEVEKYNKESFNVRQRALLSLRPFREVETLESNAKVSVDHRFSFF